MESTKKLPLFRQNWRLFNIAFHNLASVKTHRKKIKEKYHFFECEKWISVKRNAQLLIYFVIVCFRAIVVRYWFLLHFGLRLCHSHSLLFASFFSFEYTICVVNVLLFLTKNVSYTHAQLQLSLYTYLVNYLSFVHDQQ